MPIIGSEGAASSKGFGQFAQSGAVNYIEDVFSTWLYTGNDSATSITNGIDLAGKGGMVWIKSRGFATDHYVVDSQRISGGDYGMLATNLTSAESFQAGVSSFNSDGFSLDGNVTQANRSGFGPYASWTFRKQPKFFDCVTYTGNGTAGRTVAHNLGAVPGCMIVKRTDVGPWSWAVYHRSLGATKILRLNSTDPELIGAAYFNDTEPTSTEFTVGNWGGSNASGGTYVAYLFAHDAGGFGLTGTDNVISCGSYSSNPTGTVTVNLGYEPQFVMIKSSSQGSTNWVMFDNMRGVPTGGGANTAILRANLSDAETNNTDMIVFNSTGFTVDPRGVGYNDVGYPSGNSYIYIAIRRGPMKVPTDGTSVFAPVSIASAAGTPVTTGFTVDLILNGTNTTTDSSNYGFYDRLRGIPSISSGNSTGSISSSTAAEVAYPIVRNANNVGFQVGSYNGTNQQILHSFGRAPSVFDVVCYTGNDVSRTVNHNLGVAPELWIIKRRSGVASWVTGGSVLTSTTNSFLLLNSNFSVGSVTNFFTTPTATTFGFGSGAPSDISINASGSTYVAYLFASAPGVSKVFSFTGNGTTQTINCGFTGGARFVLLKASSATGGWYVYDTARGMTVSTDPYLQLNSTAAESATLGSVTTVTTGFAVNESILAGVNTNGVSYIGLAIA